MTRVCRELAGGPAPGPLGSRAPRSSWMLLASLSALGVCGCPVDERALAQRPGLVFLTGGGGDDSGFAGGATGGGGSEAGQMEAGQPGFSMGGSDFSTGGSDAGAPGSGASEAGQDGFGGSSGTGAAAGSAALGGSGGNPSGGTGGGGGSGGRLIGRCPDLDGNFVFDCDETIAKNYGFDQDTSDWSAETNIALACQVLDAAGHPDSGSLAVEDTFTSDMEGGSMLGADQCMAVNEQTLYAFAVQVSVPDGATGTTAGFQLIFYDDDNCMGSKVGIVTSPVVSGSSWNVAKLVRPTPKLTKSLLMRLVTIKPYREAPNSVLFDNVLVHRVSASSE
jgi:hypothetical protein